MRRAARAPEQLRQTLLQNCLIALSSGQSGSRGDRTVTSDHHGPGARHLGMPARRVLIVRKSSPFICHLHILTVAPQLTSGEVVPLAGWAELVGFGEEPY